MAGIRAHAQTAKISTGTAKKTLLQLVAAANHRVLVDELSVSFDGVSNTAEPILCEVARQSDAGTMSALTPAKNNVDDAETLQTTAQHTATVEPTETDVVMAEHVHPQGGFIWQAPFGKAIVISGGDRLGVAVTAAADVEAVARASFEE